MTSVSITLQRPSENEVDIALGALDKRQACISTRQELMLAFPLDEISFKSLQPRSPPGSPPDLL